MRNHRQIPIRGVGAVVPVQICVGEERRKWLRANGRVEPDYFLVTMLIDTGATCSWIRETYLQQQLGLQPRSWFDVETVDREEKQTPAYEVSLVIGGVGTPEAKHFERLVGGLDFKDKPHDGLLGRDILRELQFHWNGPGEEVKLQYR